MDAPYTYVHHYSSYHVRKPWNDSKMLSRKIKEKQGCTTRTSTCLTKVGRVKRDGCLFIPINISQARNLKNEVLGKSCSGFMLNIGGNTYQSKIRWRFVVIRS